MMLSFKYLIVIIFTFPLSLFYCDANSQVIIKFSHIAPPDSPKGLAATHFKEVAEKLTKGKVKVEIYSDSQLFKDNEEMEALQLNSVQMLAPTFSKFSSLGIHNFEVFDLPYLFRNQDELHRITQSTIGRKLLNTLDAHGVVGLGYWDNGFKDMSANKPIRSPEDMRNLRMRIQPSKVIATQMNNLGAIPFSMPFFETFKYLNNGLIDGTETTPSLFYTMNLMQSQKYLTLTNHGYMGYVVITNKKFWNTLPGEIQIQLTAAINETTKYANIIAQEKNERDLAEIKLSGKTNVIELSEKEKKLWIDALLPVRDQMETRIGKELINEIKKEVSSSRQQ
ncbi:C4-dicarboxylate-binding protein DctP [Oxalobacteraceae bacterium GrIS 2.11]